MRTTQPHLGYLGVLAAGLAFGLPAASAADVAYARHLAVCPNGQTLAFSWAGDIWTVPIGGGPATRLTAHPADDSHPVWSRDGGRLAFASDRHGAANIFIMNPDGSALRRLTFSDRGDVPTDFSPDGSWVYFQTHREGETSREPRLYRVPVGGGQPWRALDCHAAAARVSPDGQRIAFMRGSATWWRRGYRGSANFDLYVATTDGASFVRQTTFEGNDRQPAWNADGSGLYFLSDGGGTVNVWHKPIGEDAAEQVTRMTGDDVRDFSLSANGKTLAYAHWDDIYVMAADERVARAISVTAGDDTARNDMELETITKDADEAEVSPDGEEIALVVRGEIFVIKTEEDRPTRRVTSSPARDRHVTWSPDGKALFFVSDRAGREAVYRAVSAEQPPKPLSDSLRFKIERVTDDPAIEHAPLVSPDGSKLALVRGRGSLIIRDLTGGGETTLFESWNTPGFAWSPDSKWIAYDLEDREHNSDVWIVPADGSAAAVNISRHPDHDHGPRWSADGQVLAFASRRHGFDRDLYVVFLAPRLDQQSKVELDEYFEKRAEAVKKRKPPESALASGDIALPGQPPTTQPAETQPTSAPTTASQPSEDTPDELSARVRKLVQGFLEEQKKKPDAEEKPEKADRPEQPEQPWVWDLETCYQRVRRVTSLVGDQARFALSPDGGLLAFTSSHEGEPKLYTIKWDGTDHEQISSARVGGLAWELDGKRLHYVKGGVPGSCAPNGSSAKSHKFSAPLTVTHSAEAAQKFDDAARQLGLRFYHPTMKGLDWPALTRKYRELALRTATIAEFNEIFNLLQGELNASHLGIYPPDRRDRERVGYLGLELDRNYPGPGLKIAAVLPRSPADLEASKLVAGDVITAIDGQPVGPDAPLDRVLINTVGQEVIVAFTPSPTRPPPTATAPTDSRPSTQEAPTQARELVIRPASFGQIVNLQYDAWVENNRGYVSQQSAGRLGYLHIRGMGTASFDVFERDLYAAAHGRDGLIIDVRNNGGGWTADWVMAVLNVRRHAYTISRGGEPGYPQDRLIFYAWTKPATMMCNEQSFSNAEIVAHAFKNLGRGPLIGMTTHGGVISTGGYRLIDGARLRMPTRGWFTLPNGVDMENNGAVPDLVVPVMPDDEVRGRRPQLDAAIAATMAQLGPAESPRPSE